MAFGKLPNLDLKQDLLVTIVHRTM